MLTIHFTIGLSCFLYFTPTASTTTPHALGCAPRTAITSSPVLTPTQPASPLTGPEHEPAPGTAPAPFGRAPRRRPAPRPRRRSPAPHRRRRPGPHSQPQRPPPPPRGLRRCHRSDRGRQPAASTGPGCGGAAGTPGQREEGGGGRPPRARSPVRCGEAGGGSEARCGGCRRGPVRAGWVPNARGGAGRQPLPARGGSRSPRTPRRSCPARPELLLAAAAPTCPRRYTRSRSAPCAASGRLRKMAALPGETTPGARQGEAGAGPLPSPAGRPLRALRKATAALPRALPSGAPARPRWGWRRLWAPGQRGCFSTRRCCTRRCGRSCPPPAGRGSTASTAPCCWERCRCGAAAVG